MTAHVSENAELYALGALNPHDAAEVERHLESCSECARRVAEAQDAIALMIVPQQPSFALERRISSAFSPAGAPRGTGALIAAAFVLGLLPSLWFFAGNHAAPPAQQAHDAAVLALVEGHFVHAPFTRLTPDAPRAKMIFGRQGSWRYLIAEPGRAYAVAIKQGTRTTPLGRLQVNGKTAELFVAAAPSADQYLLLDGTRVVARLNVRR